MPSRPFWASFSALGLSLVGLMAAWAVGCGGSDAASNPEPVADGGTSDVQSDAAETPPLSCEAPTIACGNACVDTSVDFKNCGGCGKACKGAESCVAAQCFLVAGFAARHVFLGETDRAGVMNAEAWKTYGRNIDGITTDGATNNGECKKPTGIPPSVVVDGDDGIDNSWGKNIVPYLLNLQSTPSASLNELLEGGGRTPMLHFGDVPKRTGTVSLGLVTAESTIAPKWDGNDSRPIAESSTAAGKPKTLFVGATLAEGVLTTGDGSAPFVLSFVFGPSTLEVPIRLARVKMTIAEDGKTANQGTISGVIDTEELVGAFAKAVGSLNMSFCDSLFTPAAEAIRRSSDILIDGTQDSAKDCNAISFGVGFDATFVAVGPVAGPVAPAEDSCPP